MQLFLYSKVNHWAQENYEYILSQIIVMEVCVDLDGNNYTYLAAYDGVKKRQILSGRRKRSKSQLSATVGAYQHTAQKPNRLTENLINTDNPASHTLV